MKNTHPTPATSGRLRRLLTSALLALSVVVGTLAATVTPANAASAVFGCFRSAQGYDLWGVQVHLEAYYMNTWFRIASRPLSPNTFFPGNCALWTIAPDSQGFHYRMVVDYRAHGLRWQGRSLYIAYPGPESYDLGTALVFTCTNC